MRKITPHLWFDKEAREATEWYVSLFPGSKITNVTKLKDTPSGGDSDLVSFELAGQPFLAITAGPLFKFNPSVSFHIKCSTTQEVDAIWERLSPGGKILMPLDKYPFSERYGWVTVLFPELRKIVSAHEFDALGEQFETNEHKQFGADGFEFYRDKIAGLEKHLGIYDLAQFTPPSSAR